MTEEEKTEEEKTEKRDIGKLVDEIGYEALFTFDELAEADMPNDRKGYCQQVRMEGIRRRWILGAPQKGLVRADKVKADLEFAFATMEHQGQAFDQIVAQLQQTEFAASRLAQRLKRIEEEQKEQGKGLILPRHLR